MTLQYKAGVVQYRDRVFDEKTDFLAEVREAVRGMGPAWLRTDLPHPWAVSDWAQAFEGSPLAERLSDAALTVMETATVAEAQIASTLPYENARDAIPRALALWERVPDRFGAGGRAHAYVLWKLLQKAPDDERLLAALRRESAKPQADDLIRDLTARYLTKGEG